MATVTDPLLVVVHPGSACGSADFNLGSSAGDAARDALCARLLSWRGHVIVVDGFLSDELPSRKDLNAALKQALSAAKRSGRFAGRVFACDDRTQDWPDVVKGYLGGSGLPQETDVSVTGAWFFEDGSAGCVNAVCGAAREAGFGSVQVDPSAVSDPQGALPSGPATRSA